MPTHKEDSLMTQTEVAHYLCVKPRTLEAWRVRGGGPKYLPISQRCVRYRKIDLDEWIDQHIVANSSQSTALRQAG